MAEMPKDETIKETEIKEKDSKGKKDIKNEIAKLKADVEHWKNEYYRAFADTKNLRNTLEKEQGIALKYRAEGFIESLLPVLDSFHIALQNEPTEPALKNYLIGFQFIYRNLVSVLENEGVKEIAPVIGEDFDSNTMNATEAIESEGEANKIAKVYTKGYKLHDRMVRHASVGVTCKPKNKEEEKTEDNQSKQETKSDA